MEMIGAFYFLLLFIYYFSFMVLKISFDTRVEFRNGFVIEIKIQEITCLIVKEIIRIKIVKLDKDIIMVLIIEKRKEIVINKTLLFCYLLTMIIF